MASAPPRISLQRETHAISSEVAVLILLTLTIAVAFLVYVLSLAFLS